MFEDFLDTHLPWLSFALTSLLIELTPGPNMGFLGVVSATRGKRAGFSLVLGIALGLAVIGAFAAAGLSTLITRSALLYEALRFGGGAYLIWLAWTQWREAGQPFAQPKESASIVDGQFFRHGLVVNLLNPKAALFYVAVLPTFIDRSIAVWPQAAALTAIYVLIATLVHAVIVGLGVQARRLVGNEMARKRVERGGALVLLGIAVWMVLKTAR